MARDPAPDTGTAELNRIVEQAEALLRSLGEESSEAVDAVRHRVTETLQQARARLAASAEEAETVAKSLADRADSYVRTNPWQSVAIAALLGATLICLVSRRRE